MDVAVKDPFGNQFWKSELIGRELIPMDEFIETFKTYLSDYAAEEMDDDLPALVSDEKMHVLSDYQLYTYSIHSVENGRRVQAEFDRRYGGPLEVVQLEPNEDLTYRCLRELLRLFSLLSSSYSLFIINN